MKLCMLVYSLDVRIEGVLSANIYTFSVIGDSGWIFKMCVYCAHSRFYF